MSAPGRSVAVVVDGLDLRCAHGGRLLPMAPRGRLRSAGRLVLAAGDGHAVHDCPHVGPDGCPSPCSVVIWAPGAVRARVDGRPVLLADAPARCTPNDTGVVAPAAAVRLRSRRP